MVMINGCAEYPSLSRTLIMRPLLFPTLLAALSMLTANPSLAGDRAASGATARPAPLPTPLSPFLQTEPNTCGMHAMEAIYASYGLRPTDFKLRERLGVDRPAIPLLSSTDGSIHPDILRVLSQDGFQAHLLKLGNEYFDAKLITHLNGAHYAMTLIKRHENGNLHWVVITAYEDGQITIADSIGPRTYQRDLKTYAEDQIVSLLLVSPAEGGTSASTKEDHKAGAWEILKSLFRL
jgi:ABC-type bacteriocin/lantibiotic exporter with double-glycine peptidase domain